MMLYKKLAQLYEELSSTTKRLEKIDILAKFLEHVTAEDKDILYLLLGDIYPEYDERKIGISTQLAIKALGKATGIQEKEIVKEWKKEGDLGIVSQFFTSAKKQSTLHSHVLTAQKVLDNLRKLPELEGKGTVGKKLSLITELLTSASPIEAKYLVRTLLADLRIGTKESTIREALAKIYSKTDSRKELSEKLEDAINQSNDVAEVFEALKKHGAKGLEKIEFEIGKPVKAMLAQKAKDIPDGFKAVGTPCAVEYKYDGFRTIIHKKGKDVKIFTRRLENVTKQFPEIAEYINKYVKGKNFVLDAEAVGYDPKTKKYRAFQHISQRIRRKYDIDKMQKELPVELHVFDVLFYNGKSYINEPFKARSQLVRKIIEEQKWKIVTAKQIITSNEKEVEKFYKAALANEQEGIMFKNLNATYKPGSRVGHMLKLKPEERELDLVITGAEYGTGRRGGWLSSFILSCYDKKKNGFLEIGKMSTGLKEKATDIADSNLSFEELSKKIKPLIISEKDRRVEIKPKIVLTVTYQEIQRSPNYKSGFALRFPRFTALRPDRKADDAATLEEIKDDYERQTGKWKYG